MDKSGIQITVVNNSEVEGMGGRVGDIAQPLMDVLSTSRLRRHWRF
jgi:hypothetical protein